MAIDPVRNFIKLEVASGYDSAATSIDVVSATGLPDPSTDGAYNLIWWNRTNHADPADDPNVEIVRVTALSGTTLTVTRAQEGTQATNKNEGEDTYQLILSPTQKTIEDLETVASDYEVSQEDVTQHQAALRLTESQITDLDHYTNADVDTRIDDTFTFGTGITGTRQADGSFQFTNTVAQTGEIDAFDGVIATRATVFSLPNQTNTIIPFDAEEFDTNNYHDNQTNPSRLTVPEAGKYAVGGIADFRNWDMLASNRFRVRLRVNGQLTGVSLFDGNIASNTDTPTATNFNTLIELQAGDYVEFEFRQSSNGAKELSIGSKVYAYKAGGSGFDTAGQGLTGESTTLRLSDQTQTRLNNGETHRSRTDNPHNTTASQVGAAPTNHTHAIGDVNNLQSALNGKADNGDIPTDNAELANGAGYISQVADDPNPLIGGDVDAQEHDFTNVSGVFIQNRGSENNDRDFVTVLDAVGNPLMKIHENDGIILNNAKLGAASASQITYLPDVFNVSDSSSNGTIGLFSGIYHVTLDADWEPSFSLADEGDSSYIYIYYDGTAQRTVNYSNVDYWKKGQEPPRAPSNSNEILIVSIYCDGTNNIGGYYFVNTTEQLDYETLSYGTAVSPFYSNGNVSGATTIDAENGGRQTLTLTADTTLDITNMSDGETITLHIEHDGSAQYNLTLNGVRTIGTIDAGPAAGQTMILTLQFNGTNIVAGADCAD